jgi:CheY-like chemotaxis protein
MLRVRDTGQGMDSATLERVFEPFFTTKEVGRGTGLGLPMVYGFVKQSGGQVLVESSPGNGTLVTILFPRSLLPLPEARQVDSALMGSLEGRNENVLVAEDNDDVRAYTVESLRQLGYRVLEAHDGPSALRLLDRPDVHVDLLFSDVVMPGMSGWELARQVRLRNSDMRILFTSGYPRDLGMKGNPGANVALLAKPFTRSDLGRAVRAALEGPSQAG